MRRVSQTPSHTPIGASGISSNAVAMLRTSISPSHAYGIHFDRFTAAKNTAIVAA